MYSYAQSESVEHGHDREDDIIPGLEVFLDPFIDDLIDVTWHAVADR